MKIALHQITTKNANMEQDMRAYAEAGWSAFELHLGKANEYVKNRDLDTLGKLVRDSGLKAVGCTGHVVGAFTDSAAQEAEEATFVEALDLMEIVECPIIVFGGDGPGEPPTTADNSEAGLKARDAAYRDDLAQFAARVGHLADLAAPRGITMALEMNWCRLCRSVASAADALDRIDRDNVGFLFDDAHFAVSPSRLSDLDRVAGRIVYGHLDDMRPSPPEVTNVNSDRLIPGDGVLPLHEWYEKIESCGYHGWHSVELFCDDLWTEPVDDIARKVMEGCRRVWPNAVF
jgi:sugar phosphate isomerase/epimerase